MLSSVNTIKENIHMTHNSLCKLVSLKKCGRVFYFLIFVFLPQWNGFVENTTGRLIWKVSFDDSEGVLIPLTKRRSFILKMYWEPLVMKISFKDVLTVSNYLHYLQYLPKLKTIRLVVKWMWHSIFGMPSYRKYINNIDCIAQVLSTNIICNTKSSAVLSTSYKWTQISTMNERTMCLYDNV